MASIPDSRRAGRLYGVFKGTLLGERQLTTGADAKLFLEAIQNQQPPSMCVEKIISSTSGLDALRQSIRIDLSCSFVVSHALKFIGYLSDPGVKALADGQFLEQILVAIAQPPTLWNCLVNLYLTRGIPEEALHPFAWLVLELLSLPCSVEVDFVKDAQKIMDSGILMQATSHEARQLGYRIRKVLQIKSCAAPQSLSQASTPGGRHDNDHANFRDIAIYPTRDELLSTTKPFYQTARDVFDTDEASRASVHLDNQFRLLREDMLAELREDLQVATGKKKGKRKLLTLGGLDLIKLHIDEDRVRKPCLLGVGCTQGLPVFDSSMDISARREFWKGRPNILKHQAFGVLYRAGDIYGFASVDRDVDQLCASPPVVLLQFTDSQAFRRAILALKNPKDIKFSLVDTPVFAYEPVLDGLKRITELPLQDFLLNPKGHSAAFEPEPAIQQLITMLEKSSKNADGLVELPVTGPTLDTSDEAAPAPDPLQLDESQLASLINSLKNPVTVIQGPPGTGKSLLGALAVKYIHDLSELRILVISYTNHALDQFLEDLLDTGIEQSAMVRLGSESKCTAKTTPLLLFNQRGEYRRSRETWLVINSVMKEAKDIGKELKEAFQTYRNFKISWADIEEHLEFSESDRNFYEAFKVPSDDSGWKVAGGGRNREVSPDYLFQRWDRGEKNPGIFQGNVSDACRAVWYIPKPIRRSHTERWTQALVNERLETILELARQYNDLQQRLETLSNVGNGHILRTKRVVGCTTTAAAKYASLIRQAMPDVVLVEEAGEILESHILTSLAPTVQQLILIGDHKQLRPKVNNYSLTVERGEGFDLNRSLFERMILQEAPYTTLRKQHRMAPEISVFPRALTYPDLLDGPKTTGRPRIRGLQDRVIFLNHAKLEEEDNAIADRREPGTKASKKNTFEAEMVLKCVRYLAQQGYVTENMVVLTPYLGQLRHLRDMLVRETDPVLNDLDAFELIRAGLATTAAAKVNKTPLRISTIDNYQGEESDIVIASLTRSNAEGDVGFMKAPERLNVLLSRARNCLILIGNAVTFMNSKRGKDSWMPFFELLKANKHLYDGLPVVCERHPDKTALLGEPRDFDKCCPDGGCAEPCNAKLKCGVHKCQLRCHRVTDHSKTECSQLVEKSCNRQHRTRVWCRNKNDVCLKCIDEDKEQERRIRRDLKLEADRLRYQEAYAKELQELQDELDHQRRLIKDQTDREERKKTLAQQRADLAALKETAARMQEQKQETQHRELAASQPLTEAATSSSVAGTQNTGNDDEDKGAPGSAKEEWQHLKDCENAKCKPLDELMEMIGLEDVKTDFLSVKSKVDTAVRQCVPLAKERFSCSLLGNPGTGKTTVARLYAQFLANVGVIPGTCFKEETGSSLANLGVSGCKKLLEDILNNGGGVLFIDEAYQLTSGNNTGGSGVLDFLLAEVENLTGKVIFVLAGYNKQMESFFAHNPGLPSRFPIDMKFSDYTDDEILRILEQKINNKYSKRMQCEDGLRGLYCRIVARRIGRGRGSDGFGNARAVENTLASICRRQANRLRQERRSGTKPTDFLFTKEDLIGPEPSDALAKCEAWGRLQTLIGLSTVKEAVQALVDSVQQNYKRELAEEPIIEYTLNKVFLGSPGTGKTAVAEQYGGILADLGLLSKGEVIVKNPSDFVGGALGQSEQQTKGILASTIGKVLVIDEAYGLYGGGGVGSTSDPYKTAVIDTIVAEVQGVPGDDRCVLLLGYKDQMEEMFQNVNPGLSRRFPVASAFTFEDFTDSELRLILDLKLGQQGFQATDEAKVVAMEMLDRCRNRPNFGNAGEVDTLLNEAKTRHQKRLSRGEAKLAATLEALDFDENFNRAQTSETNVGKLFEGVVGCEQIVERLEGYQETVRIMKGLDMDPKENIPFNFLFRGPPGTGKTTTAKKMGEVFYNMGFLATAEVVECSATDLIGQFVGQTGPKVQNLLDKALGRVLFVDEAYRLAGGNFAKEAMDELVDSTTKTRYNKKLVIILAGYEEDINQLMSANPGLTSRFPETIDFRRLLAHECAALLTKLLKASKKRLAKKSKDFDLTVLETPSEHFAAAVLKRFSALAKQENWASARDVQTLAKAIFNKTIKSTGGSHPGGPLKVEEVTIETELWAMFDERAARAAAAMKLKRPSLSAELPFPLPEPTVLRPTATTTKAEHREHTQANDAEDEAPPKRARLEYEGSQDSSAQRDAGVSDEVWEQLQRDRKAAEAQEEEFQRLLEARRHATDVEREKIVRRLLEEQRRREEEAQMRQKLQAIGLCPAGYQWIKQASGYRCAGGSHFVDDAQLRA